MAERGRYDGGYGGGCKQYAALTPKRTEYGKQIRKQYEAHEISARRGLIQKLEPRFDGYCNTLTTVLKDNYILVVEEIDE